MTREDRALEHLHGSMPELARLLQIGSRGGESWLIHSLLSFADAEAAAMRERAAGVANDAAEAARPYANGVGLGPATERHRMLEAERIAAAIRALPGRGSERQRYITTWRKRPPESVLDWDHYVSEDDAELEGVIKNLKAQGVKQWNTFRLGERVASQSSEH